MLVSLREARVKVAMASSRIVTLKMAGLGSSLRCTMKEVFGLCIATTLSSDLRILLAGCRMREMTETALLG
jgi:hypothetical protein